MVYGGHTPSWRDVPAPLSFVISSESGVDGGGGWGDPASVRFEIESSGSLAFSCACCMRFMF